MTTQEFNKLLHMAVDKGNLDPEKTYIALTWWKRIFLPLDIMDSDGWREHKTFFLVFGDDELRLGCYKLPLGFYIDKTTNWIDRVIRHPLTLSKIIDSKEMLSYDSIKFIICHSPINSRTDINPFKTRIIKNFEGDTILCFYIEDRDSGEMVEFNRMTAEDIQLIDGTKSVGEYTEYGTWKSYNGEKER